VHGVDKTTAHKDYTSRMNDEALEQIQTKIAFLERATSELSDVVFRQHGEIQALEAKLKAIVDRLSAAQSDEAPRAPDQEKPPHY
jgi:SlyX protein